MTTHRSNWLRACSFCALMISAAACESDSDDGDPSDASSVEVGDAGGSETPSENKVDAAGPRDDAGSPETVTAEKKTLVEVAAGDSRFTSLVAAVKKAGLVDALSGAGPLTVFAPTDQAFTAALAALGKTLDQLSADDLKPILTYHVLASAVKSGDLKAGPVKTLSGVSAFVSTSGGAKINGASVVNADIAASNGVIHVIDKVLLPPNLVEAATLAGDFSTLIGAVSAAGLAETLAKPDANLTVFAPNNAAFAKLSAVPSGDALKNALLYHVVSGKVLSTDLKAGPVPTLLSGKNVTVDLSSGARINDAKVIAADVVTTNGVIHVLDTVLIPPS